MDAPQEYSKGAVFLYAVARYAVCAAIGGVGQYLAFLPDVNKHVHEHHDPVFDVVHAIFPDWDHTDPNQFVFALSDKLVILWALATVSLIVLQGRGRRIALACLWMKLHGILLLLRAGVVWVTLFKSPVIACRNVSDRPDISGFLIPIGCNDTMFSGHTSFMMLCCMFFYYANNSSIVGKAASCVAGAFSCLMLAAIRDHYTADVIVAIYLTVMLCAIYHSQLTALFAAEPSRSPTPSAASSVQASTLSSAHSSASSLPEMHGSKAKETAAAIVSDSSSTKESRQSKV